MSKIFLRHRWLFLVAGSIIAFGLSLYSDPDHGIATALGITGLFQGIWAVAAAHYSRKWVLDYPEANQRLLFSKAAESPTGAGLALVALAIAFLAFALIFSPRAHAQAGKIPSGFYKYGHQLKTEQQKYWPTHPDASKLAALIEQESCVSMKSSRCWNPSSRLKTNREEGAGFGQITRAYRADGSLRFDALASLQQQYSSELAGWSWGNVYARPDLQLRAIVLMSRDAVKPFRLANDALQMGDSAYNGGIADVQKARRACALIPGCDAS